MSLPLHQCSVVVCLIISIYQSFIINTMKTERLQQYIPLRFLRLARELSGCASAVTSQNIIRVIAEERA